jgi:hypothetical protein
MTRFPTKWRRARAVLAAVALAIAVPAATSGAQGHPNPATPFVTPLGGASVVPLINSGDVFDGETFEGIPDGLGIVPVGNGQRFIDIYVAFEQSHVPFGGFADFEDSSVQVARLDLKTQQIVSLEEVLPASAGFIRFCSAFMAGPEQGFNNYTFFVNEESNDVITVPAGAKYGADPSLIQYRQAGYSVWLDTKTGDFKPIPGMGRHNHENTVIIPGGWDDIVSLSGDDTFSAPSSQLYMYNAASPGALKQDKGSLWAFQVTGVDGVPLADPDDPFNNANDYLEIVAGVDYQGHFIPVPDDVADGTTAARPQTALEDWSNANNVFQFVRVEDVDYDPDNPRDVYFADTGTNGLIESETTGRLIRSVGAVGAVTSFGRIFKMVLNEDDPTEVDSFSIFADSADAASAFANPDNLDISSQSMMVQEDSSSLNDVWMYSFDSEDWSKVATTNQGGGAETSGIVDASAWLGDGWWIFDVQSHLNLTVGPGGLQYQTLPTGSLLNYNTRREAGQLLLMYVAGS